MTRVLRRHGKWRHLLQTVDTAESIEFMEEHDGARRRGGINRFVRVHARPDLRAAVVALQHSRASSMPSPRR